MNIRILNKVGKINKGTIKKNGSDDRTLRYTRNNLVKFIKYIIYANTLFAMLDMRMYVKC